MFQIARKIVHYNNFYRIFNFAKIYFFYLGALILKHIGICRIDAVFGAVEGDSGRIVIYIKRADRSFFLFRSYVYPYPRTDD